MNSSTGILLLAQARTELASPSRQSSDCMAAHNTPGMASDAAAEQQLLQEMEGHPHEGTQPPDDAAMADVAVLPEGAEDGMAKR